MGDAASGARFTPGFAESTEVERESVFWSMADRPADGTPPPPGWFLRKNVILGELERCEMQECDSKGVVGWGARLTKENSTGYMSCQ